MISETIALPNKPAITVTLTCDLQVSYAVNDYTGLTLLQIKNMLDLDEKEYESLQVKSFVSLMALIENRLNKQIDQWT